MMVPHVYHYIELKQIWCGDWCMLIAARPTGLVLCQLISSSFLPWNLGIILTGPAFNLVLCLRSTSSVWEMYFANPKSVYWVDSILFCFRGWVSCGLMSVPLSLKVRLYRQWSTEAGPNPGWSQCWVFWRLSVGPTGAVLGAVSKIEVFVWK